MPRIIACENDTRIGLDQCIAGLAESGYDPRDEGSLYNAAVLLRQLGNDRDFLGDMLIDELKEHHRNVTSDSAYGPQAIMLSDARHGFFLRANIWPSEQDSVFAASGAHNFSYGTAHDHNFDFLTLGYFGPGYASDYYEYDYGKAAGYVGEKAGLRFVERSRLDPGKLMLYRAHLDVHNQLPPESLSVSLNIMAIDPAQGWHDQYAFDTDRDEITRVLNPTSTETFLRLAMGLGDANAIDLAEHFGTSHPSDRIRLASYHARALNADKAAQDAIWREAELSGSLLVRTEAKRLRGHVCA